LRSASLRHDIENCIDHELRLIELNVVSRLRSNDLPAVEESFSAGTCARTTGTSPLSTGVSAEMFLLRFARVGSKHLLSDDFVVLTMSTDPNPHDAIQYVNAECAVMHARTNRSKFTDAREVQ
jgi:hypothetical protein